jgi:hypothetical protein
LFECFASDGQTTIVVERERTGVFDSTDDDPVVLVDDRVSFVPSAFAPAPPGWWTIQAETPRTALRRVLGPVIDTFALDGATPGEMVVDLIDPDGSVSRIDARRFQIADDGERPTITDVTLDAHGHPAEIAVAAEDERRPGRRDEAQASYRVRYRDVPTRQLGGHAEIAALVNAGDLGRLDVRPGACGAAVAG